ncbi:MAG: LD-carboxypeptidase [Candidatus Kapabacteria bacterium]|nr:LD-carboxypeptidase [Ignavibacteriota bacterium]MCW5885429.1 LD-carboxypeptidase [Candidatus Kapabacteria bacterium]
MEKRDFLKISALASTGIFMGSGISYSQNKISKNPEIKKIKPKALKAGDKVRIVSPGTAVSDPDDIQKATEIVLGLGLEPIFSNHLIYGSGYKTRTIPERVNDIHEAFLDKSASAVFCIRGGYGSAQLVDSIYYDIIRNNPKVFCGYSDITALHSAIGKKTGLVTFHSPVLLSPFTPYTQDIFTRMLFTPDNFGELRNPTGKYGLRASYPIRTIISGIAQGEITGGNLSLISSLVGTDYAINSKGKILVLEDVGEPPYRIDRMMNQLRLNGLLEDAEGIIFGKCSDCVAGTHQSTWDYSLGEVLDFYLKPLNKPAFYGLMFGHTSEQATIPLGCKALMDSSSGTLDIVENCVE